jgi:hypothetical protein
MTKGVRNRSAYSSSYGHVVGTVSQGDRVGFLHGRGLDGDSEGSCNSGVNMISHVAGATTYIRLR